MTYGGVTRRTRRGSTTSPVGVRVVFPLVPEDLLRRSSNGDKGDGGGFGSPVGVSRGGGGNDEGVAPSDPSDARVGDGRTLPLRVRVMDWSPLGEPRCIGEASYAVDVRRLRREASDVGKMKAGKRKSDAGGPLGMREVSLPLRRTKGGFVKLLLGAAASGGWATVSGDTPPRSLSAGELPPMGGSRAGDRATGERRGSRPDPPG